MQYKKIGITKDTFMPETAAECGRIACDVCYYNYIEDCPDFNMSISDIEPKCDGLETLLNQCLKSRGYEEYIVKILKTDEIRTDRSIPRPADIIYTDGKIVHEEYVVDDVCEISVYAGNQADSPRKYTIYPSNVYIDAIRWV